MQSSQFNKTISKNEDKISSSSYWMETKLRSKRHLETNEIIDLKEVDIYDKDQTIKNQEPIR